MVQLLGYQRDPGHEPEGFAEVGELELAVQLAVDQLPTGHLRIIDQDGHGDYLPS